jgi:hypothetical protein
LGVEHRHDRQTQRHDPSSGLGILP